MKKNKSMRSVLIITTLVIAFMLSFMQGGFNHFASAASEYDPVAFFSGKIVKKVKLTDNFTVPDTVDADVMVTVKAPDGTIAANNSQGYIGNICANQAGNYIITYSKGKTSYSYNVYCYEEKEYFINVKAKEDDFIPAYRRSSDSDNGIGREEDSIIKLPYFELAYKNEKGEVIAIKNADYDIDFTFNAAEIKNRQGVVGNPAINEGKKQLQNLSKGILKITLKARVNTSTPKWYTKEYTVNVQKNFVNDNVPTVSVTNFSPNGSINALYTLPIATAKDSYENNVFVNVSVIAPDGNPVKHYEANEYSYADLGTECGVMIFDNKDVRSFYLTQEGDYKVTYTAVNGSGVRSVAQAYTIKDVKDRLAPVITEIDEWQIPNKWGISNVNMGDGAEKPKQVARPEGTEFTIPFPMCIDNYSKTENLWLTITLVNPNNRTVGNWNGNISEYFDNGVALSDTYRNYFKYEYSSLCFKDSGMKFSFDRIDFSNSRLNRDEERLGDWTLTYSVRDEENNGGSGNARKSYIITVQDSFTDLNPPAVSKEKFKADIPEYVKVIEGGETFRIPYVTVSDDNATSRMKIEYAIETIINDADKPTGNKITVDSVDYELIYSQKVNGGEQYTVREYAGKYYVLINGNNKNFAMPLSTKDVSRIGISFTATDNVGNISETLTDEFKIVCGGVNKGYNLTADFQKVTQALEAEPDFTVGKKVNGKLVPKKLGGFDVTGIKDYEFTGFELSVLNEKGSSQEISSYNYFHKTPRNNPNDDNEAQLYDLHVRNIEFIPSYGGEYRLNVRIFDIFGKSQAYGFSFEISGATVVYTQPAATAAKIGSTGEVNVAYELEREYIVTPVDKYADGIIVRFISGRNFTLAGYEFTALSISTYRITDYTYDYNLLAAQTGFDTDFSDMLIVSNGHHQKTYKPFAANDNGGKPVIEVLGVIPAHHPITDKMRNVNETGYKAEEYVTLPVITAYTKYGNANIEVKVSFNGSDVNARELFYESDEYGNSTQSLTFDQTTLIKDTDGTVIKIIDNQSTGMWAFPAVNDGIYIINITAMIPNSNTEAAYKIFEIHVGKMTLPEFYIMGKQTTAKVGDKFKMGRPVFDIGEDWESVNIRLLGPDGFEIPNSATKLTLNGAAALANYENWETEYEFEKAGNYTVIITAIDSVGLTSEQSYTITVTFESDDRAQTPDITKQPVGKTVAKDGKVTLSVTAAVTDGGTLSYQWYSNTSNSNEGGTLISGAADAEYIPDTSTEGTIYYYCIITNTQNGSTAAIPSNVAKVTVKTNVQLCGGCGSISTDSGNIFSTITLILCALFVSFSTILILSQRSKKDDILNSHDLRQ